MVQTITSCQVFKYFYGIIIILASALVPILQSHIMKCSTRTRKQRLKTMRDNNKEHFTLETIKLSFCYSSHVVLRVYTEKFRIEWKSTQISLNNVSVCVCVCILSSQVQLNVRKTITTTMTRQT